METSSHPDDTLRQWRSSLMLRRVDVVGDFAGKELFGVHGEALVAHCLALAQVDYEDGFQLLHTVYAVERFLSELQRCGCNFHILWFDDCRSVSVPHSASAQPAKYLLTRAVLIEHFRNPPNPTCLEGHESTLHASRHSISFVFPSIFSDEFRQYIGANALHFILCSDAEPGQLDTDDRLTNHLAAMYSFMQTGHSLGFVNDIEFQSTKVYTNVVMPSRSPLPLSTIKFKNLQQYMPELDLSQTFERLSNHPWATTRDVSVREQIAVVTCASVLSAEPSTENQKHVAAFLIHVALLERTSLSQRSYPKPKRDNSHACEQFLEKYSYIATNIIQSWHRFYNRHQTNMDVFDLVDGRLYQHVLNCLDTLNLVTEVSPYIRVVRDLVGSDVLSGLLDCTATLSSQKTRQSDSIVEKNTAEPREPSHALLPFNHPVFDRYLGDMRLQTDSSWKPPTTSLIFQDLTHWHNAKKPVDPKHVKKPLGYFARKRNQKFMADTIAYSASLTNASGKNIDPEIIAVQVDNGKHSGSSPKISRSKQPPKPVKGKTKPSGKQAAREAAMAIQTRRMENKSSAVINFWQERCKEFQRETSLVKRYLKAAKYFSSLSKSDVDTIGAEVLLFLCSTLCLLRESSRNPTDTTSLGIVALAWANVLEMQSLPMNIETRQHAERLATALKLPLGPAAPGCLPRRLPFEILIRKAAVTLPMNEIEFQLEHCGPYLERSFDSAPDPRVPFNPDAWQRRVLDAIDEDKSLFVVAPTSAGKTFISFYAMKKVLQANDDDVLVYVAPTKALVNQIAAEIQARFSKSYRHEGRSVWAIHTRDYRVNNPNGCQVLVTVPHILQIMLLAPSNAQVPKSWARRVKRIIFDEVHCIGQAEDGVIWEQLLLLAPCPIIALSATVGNPLEFKEWLAGTQKSKGFDLIMVTHSARYSDLRKFLYTPPTDFEFKGLKTVERLPFSGLDAHGGSSPSGSRFAFVHPIGSIVSKDKATLDDASLEPRDCFRLWRAMSTCENEAFPLDPNLIPERFLPSNFKKSNVLEWEQGLKGQLFSWMTNPESPFSACQKMLRNDDPEEPTQEKSTQENRASTFPLLVDLRNLGALPAILFNYDRNECEKILFTITEILETAEQQYRETSSVWKKKISDFEKWRVANSKPHAASPKLVKQSEMTKADMVREMATQEKSPWESFYPDDPLSEFSFADVTKISRDELETMLSPLRSLVRPQFIDALRRGLGVHHAGMNRQYRQVVELLFRRSVLTAVIATGTLALGINMPCKTVVFTGDSVYLTALNYRQGSGRAGRRGFDLLGNVVFHRIPPHRAREIMSSRLPDLRGTFPISVTLILRLLGLLHGTQNSDYAVKAIDSLFTQTRLYLGGPASQMSITHHLRFSLEYLRRQDLLSEEGTPLNFAGLVGHLYFTENAVFAFHSLLKEGYFHELTLEIKNRSKQGDILLTLVRVLCHLFCRVPCHRYADNEWLSKVVHSSTSIVILPELPQWAKDILTAHNKATLGIFSSYVHTYVQQHLKDVVDTKLPFTKRLAEPKEPVDIANIGVPILPAPIIRSPFAALSGLTDDFGSIHELVTTARTDVFLDQSAIPYIPIYPEETNNVPFNAYIFDFFKHGDIHALVRDNGIRRGDVWFFLKDFSLILATIVVSLETFLSQDAKLDDAAMADIQDVSDAMEEGSDDEEYEDAGVGENTSSMGKLSVLNVYRAFKLLQSQFDEKFKKVWA